MTIAPATFTNYTVLCKVPAEDDKLYYWENFEKLLPQLDPLMARCATTKVISWQHFERLRWDAKEQTLRSSSTTAPTGGSNNSWTRTDLEKIFTLYLGDRTLHRYRWNGDLGPLPLPPLDKRGYIFHYSTTVLGNVERLKPLRTTDWYNRETDFRFQIPYWFGQFSRANMQLDFCFNDGFLPADEREALVRNIAAANHGIEVYRRGGLRGPGAFVHTFDPGAEAGMQTGAKDPTHWQRIS